MRTLRPSALKTALRLGITPACLACDCGIHVACARTVDRAHQCGCGCDQTTKAAA